MWNRTNRRSRSRPELLAVVVLASGLSCHQQANEPPPSLAKLALSRLQDRLGTAHLVASSLPGRPHVPSDQRERLTSTVASFERSETGLRPVFSEPVRGTQRVARQLL